MRSIEREREWIQASPRARQAKNKARFQRYEELVAKSADKAPQTAQIVIPVAERLGQMVIEADALAKAYGENLLFRQIGLKAAAGRDRRRDRPNGAGKTTLFRLITGQEKPDSGAIKIGETVKLGYVDQSRDSLDGKKTVWEESRVARSRSSSASAVCRAAPMWRRSTSRAATSRRSRLALGRRAQPRASRQDAEIGRQCIVARRAHQRSRCRYAARA